MASDGYTIRDEPDDEPSAEAPAPKRKRRDKRALLLSGVDFSRTPDGVAYASVPHMRGHREHMPVHSSAFRVFLLTTMYQRHGVGLSGQALAELISLAEARALDSGDVRPVWRRVGIENGRLYLDLGGGDPNGERRAVEISSSGWRVLAPEDVPVAFVRGRDAQPQVEPEPDGAKPADLCRFVNVANGDELALVWAWLVCALRAFSAGGSYPALLLHGEQGSGKTAAARVLQLLLDPSSLISRTLPREERDLFITAVLHHLLAFDNLSGIGDIFADCLCRITTGGGFSARALHTDGDEAIFVAVRPLLLNGIPSTLLGRPDLADRAISIELRPLAQRREESELSADFALMRPGLLGLLCDGLSAALRNLPTTKIADPPRMIDACTWAEAAAPGLGLEPGSIAAAWRANRGAADRAALEVDDVAQAVVRLLDEETERSAAREWKGSPAELYRRLCDLVSDRVSRGPLWPKNAAGLGTKLRRIAPGMRAVHGIECAHGKGGADGTRFWSLRRL